MEWVIDMYQTDTGTQPFSEWLDSISDKTTKVTIHRRLERLEMGNFGNCEPVGDGISELKIHLGPGFRIYFGKVGRNHVLLLCAGSKRSQKSDIEKAKTYFEDYKKRRE